jgi:hypothetical protein
VIEEDMPVLHDLPDTNRYDVLEGGIQIQAGSSVTGFGTLGCIAKTRDDPPKILAITCHHVVALWGAKPGNLRVWTSDNGQELIFWNSASARVLINVAVTLMPTGPGAANTLLASYTTTAADTLVTVAANVGAAITALANPSITVTSSADGDNGKVTITPAAGFTLSTNCRLQPLWATIGGGPTITFGGQNVPGSIVVVQLYVTPPGMPTRTLDIICETFSGETPTTIATRIAADITALADPSVPTAVPVGPQVTITTGPGATVVAEIGWKRLPCETSTHLAEHVDGQLIQPQSNIKEWPHRLEVGKDVRRYLNWRGHIVSHVLSNHSPICRACRMTWSFLKSWSAPCIPRHRNGCSFANCGSERDARTAGRSASTRSLIGHHAGFFNYDFIKEGCSWAPHSWRQSKTVPSESRICPK